jgi:RNA-directed DNA polymerase
MAGTRIPSTVSTRLEQIAKRAKEAPGLAFQNLAHLIDGETLLEAFRRTRKDGAAGVDKQTAADYESNLEANLLDLWQRMKDGRYFAPPVRRVNIPKGEGKTRPIGVPTFEDKVAQRAVAMVLEAVYEQDFYDCSHGFRPGRSPHTALEAFWKQAMSLGGGWVLEVDIEKFFDTLDHRHLRDFLDRRVQDKGIRRLIGKWLNAGVMEEGQLSRPEFGTPQGGVISPLLANVYLHEVLDRWFYEMASPALDGPVFLVRYADDFIILCRLESDARRLERVIPKRFAKFGLRVNLEKSRLVDFRRPRSQQGERDGNPGTFDLLGFTHYWGRSLKGRWIVKRRTAGSRMKRAIGAAAEWCRGNRHRPVTVQHKRLSSILRGHFQYYGVTGNHRRLNKFKREVIRNWRKWLDRTSQRAKKTWAWMNRFLEKHPLPPVKLYRSYLHAAKP